MIEIPCVAAAAGFPGVTQIIINNTVSHPTIGIRGRKPPQGNKVGGGGAIIVY